MKPTPIPDLYELPHKADVYCTAGTLKAVFPRKTGTTRSGTNAGQPWSLQNLVLTDENGNEIPVKLDGRNDEIPKSWMGRTVMFEAHKGERGWSGLYAIDDPNQNDQGTTRKLKVTGTGVICLVDESGATSAPPAAQQKQAPPANPNAGQKAPPPPRQNTGNTTATSAQKQAPQPPKVGTPEQLREAAGKANQIANLQIMCLRTTAEYTAPRFKEVSGRELTVQEIHAVSTSMAIELMRQGVHWTLPTTRHEPKPAPADPPPPAGDEAGEPPTTPATWLGKPWPKGALPHPETGEPYDPTTGNYCF